MVLVDTDGMVGPEALVKFLPTRRLGQLDRPQAEAGPIAHHFYKISTGIGIEPEAAPLGIRKAGRPPGECTGLIAGTKQGAKKPRSRTAQSLQVFGKDCSKRSVLDRFNFPT